MGGLGGGQGVWVWVWGAQGGAWGVVVVVNEWVGGGHKVVGAGPGGQ